MLAPNSTASGPPVAKRGGSSAARGVSRVVVPAGAQAATPPSRRSAHTSCRTCVEPHKVKRPAKRSISRAGEVRDDRGVGGEGEWGRRPKGKVSNSIEVVSRFEDSADRAPMKPDSDRLVRSVVKVGMNRTDAADLDNQTGLFFHLPARRLPDVLTPVDVAAGNAPPPR